MKGKIKKSIPKTLTLKRHSRRNLIGFLGSHGGQIYPIGLRYSPSGPMERLYEPTQKAAEAWLGDPSIAASPKAQGEAFGQPYRHGSKIKYEG